MDFIKELFAQNLEISRDFINTTAANKPEILIFAAIIIPLLIYIFGVWKGATGKITVYRNFNDVMLIALLVIIPVTAVGIFLEFSDLKELNLVVLYTSITLEALFLLIILIRTWQDNTGIFSTLLALYVKLPTGILFFSQLFNMFSDKTRKKRRESTFWTLMLLPLLYALVKDKKAGFLAKTPISRN